MTQESQERGGTRSFFADLDLWTFAKDIIAPSVVIAAIAYYIGWSVHSAYYLSFGLDPSFIAKPFNEVVTGAWPELFIMAAGVIFGVALYRLIEEWLNPRTPADIRFWRWVSILFVVLVLSAIGAGVLALYLVRVSGRLLSALEVLAVSVVLLWLCILIGRKLDVVRRAKPRQTKLDRAFRVLFPSTLLYSTVLALVILYLISRVGAWHGYVAAANDIGPNENLVSVSLFSRDPLPLRGVLDQATGLYTYRSLKLIDATEQYLYVLERTTPISPTVGTPSFATFVIPRNDRLLMQVSR
jgi:hypothetical protein